MAENTGNNPVRNSGSQSEPVSNGTGKSNAALREEAVLQYWKENKIFEKSLKQTEGRKEFIFYDGPVTANSKPVLHTMVPFSFKDAIPRYKTMRGYHVRRKGGWDTHGLPVELQVEKKLGLNSKKAIEEYGIAKFNRECRESVWENVELWKSFTSRMGYWADQENAYVTYYNDYIESLWDVIKKINEQGLLYKDYKVVPWCPRCGTALSSHELAQGYEDVKDLSVYVKFKVKNQENTYLLAWTTTPWTLPGNVALAVGKDIDYVKVKDNDDFFWFAKNASILHDKNQVIDRKKGKDFVGLEYEPLFPFLANNISGSEKYKLEKAYKVYSADFVNTEDGTGIVHTAVMYGQDDFELGTKIGLPKHHLVDLEGKFIKGTGFLESRFVKEKDANGKPTLDVDIIKYLTKKNFFFKKESYEHSYPHCWRCHTALIYYARDSWYIRMSDPEIKKKLISENKTINWEPAHTRDGRFGEWLREVKDWAISRERYWGTPLPLWQCVACKKTDVVGSVQELKEKTKKSGNKYFIMRHGEAIDNAEHIYDPKGDPNNHLTDNGKNEAILSGQKLKREAIDMIISSPFIRTQETAEIVLKELGLPLSALIMDDRLHEYNEPAIDLVQRRMGEFIFETEKTFSKKNILIISHGNPVWVLEKVAGMKKYENFSDKKMLKTAEFKEMPFIPFPHDENYELDLHRPFIDEVKLSCSHSTSSGQACGGDLLRVKEMMDVWFDSGAMPFAQDHYPFENKKWVEGKGYPADFISEAIDQTRGWFYTLHAVGVLMGRGKAFKNVICLGHLLDASGRKMSKSIGNVVEPFLAMDKYGADTLRLWMYSVNQPGESKNFDEKTVALLQQQVFGLLYNVLAFYDLYRDKNLEKIHLTPSPLSLIRRGVGERSNVLDQWILARLDELIKISTENLDNYKLLEPARSIRDFINDLSTWYLRRSRERIKNGDEGAKQTLYFILKTLAKIMASFAPFTAEDVWLKLKTEKDPESVHLSDWPKLRTRLNLVGFLRFNLRGENKIIENMEKVRKIVTFGLEARQQAQIKVRQPLSKLRVKSEKLSGEYLDLIKEELNVKEIFFDDSIPDEVELDVNISAALKAEGEYREFIRDLQEKRKKMGLAPGDKMAMSIETIYKKYKIMPSLQEHMLRVAAVASLICDNFNEPLPKEEIITVCLFHDMGNIIKSRFEFMPQFLEPEGLEYWQKIKNDYIEKYGTNDHEANLKIIKEIGLSEKVILLADQIKFSLLCDHRNGNDFVRKIICYADGRVSPYGIVSYNDRMEEVRGRYKDREDLFPPKEGIGLIKCGKEIEKQIFAKCRIKPEDINDKTVASIILDLHNFLLQ